MAALTPYSGCDQLIVNTWAVSAMVTAIAVPSVGFAITGAVILAVTVASGVFLHADNDAKAKAMNMINSFFMMIMINNPDFELSYC
jgi:ABC-type thiamin/hydroxymethylpyrimidine transport system permease subunit